MFHLERSVPVNPLDDPGTPRLSRADLWRGLVLKAETPVDFVPAITACTVVERSGNTLVRDIVLRGEEVRERVVFEPQRTVTFERLRGSVMGTIINEIVEEADGTLMLRFEFDLEVADMEPGGPMERDFTESMGDSYLEAVETTLANVRRLVKGGEIA